MAAQVQRRRPTAAGVKPPRIQPIDMAQFAIGGFSGSFLHMDRCRSRAKEFLRSHETPCASIPILPCVAEGQSRQLKSSIARTFWRHCGRGGCMAAAAPSPRRSGGSRRRRRRSRRAAAAPPEHHGAPAVREAPAPGCNHPSRRNRPPPATPRSSLGARCTRPQAPT